MKRPPGFSLFSPRLRRWRKSALPVVLSAAFHCGARAGDFRPDPGPEQSHITVQCGKLALLLRRSSQWTPGRIDYRGVPMTTEKSAYGTVFLYPDIGFIGTNHLENEPEELKSLTFFLDGQPVASPGEALSAGTFRFLRESRIRSFGLTCEVELKGDRIYETTTVTASQATPLKLVYHFMHAWKPSVSAYLAGTDEEPGEVLSGALLDTPDDTRRFFIQKPVDWVAVFEPGSGQFAVSRLLECPADGGHSSKIWNVPGTYRKYYLTSFQNQTVPAGFTGVWRMVTAFGDSALDQWEAAATRLAAELRE